MSNAVLLAIRKLARKADVMGGWVWICVDCSHTAKRVHAEKYARIMAVAHVQESNHSVRMLELK